MWKRLSVVSFLGMVAALSGLVLAGALFSPAPVVVAVQAAAVGLMVWARVTFGRRSFHAAADPTAGGLVTSGPYRYIRHPIYTAVYLFACAGALGHVSPLTGGLVVLLLIGAIGRMLCEERLITARYPEYAPYAARTRRMIPGVF